MSHNTQVNSTENTLPCLANHSVTDANETPDVATMKGFYGLITILWFPILDYIVNLSAWCFKSTFLFLSLWEGRRLVHVDLCFLGKHVAWNWRDSHHAFGGVLSGWLFQTWKHSFLFGFVNKLFFLTFMTSNPLIFKIFKKSHFSKHNLFIFPAFIASAFIHTVGMLGPMVGYMMGSFISKIYVDVGFVDLGMWFLKNINWHFFANCVYCNT